MAPEDQRVRRLSPTAPASTRFIRSGLLALAVYTYGFWLTGGRFDLLSHATGIYDLTFNSMLEHLLRGRFDVDPAMVGLEGFRRDGQVYAYWGPFCALLRLPLLLFPGGLNTDLTGLSCFAATATAAYVKSRSLLLVYRNSPPSELRELLYWTLLVVVLFSGPQIQFLSPMIYQEVCLWAGAIAAVFIYQALRGLIEGFDGAGLCLMAALAGTALLTRVSTGVGLYVALAALLASLAIRAKSVRAPAPLQLLAPLLIVAVFAALAGFVNFERWGNPMVFADYRYYLYNQDFPDRWPRTVEYGLFNLARLPFGMIYYFLPIWVLHRSDGSLLFEATQRRLVDSAELPPGSFLLTDGLLLLLAVYAAVALLRASRGGPFDRWSIGALAAGFAVPCVLMLCAISMCFRYRIEFYPLLEFGAFLGFLLACRSPRALIWRGGSAPLLAAAALGIAASFATLVLYKISWLGPSAGYLRAGTYTFYMHEFVRHYPRLAAWLFQ